MCAVWSLAWLETSKKAAFFESAGVWNIQALGIRSTEKMRAIVKHFPVIVGDRIGPLQFLLVVSVVYRGEREGRHLHVVDVDEKGPKVYILTNSF